MHTCKPIGLEHALNLPGASLEAVRLKPEELSLFLLHLSDSELQLSSTQIAHFWQQLPYWAFAWAGGRALVQWLKLHPEEVQGKRVLDFGCGSGLVAIAAAQAGAAEVWVADLDPNALRAAQHNAQLNHVSVKLVAQNQWPAVDILLASDVLYDISSSADLRALMLNVPHWLLAESQFVKPNFVKLQCLQQFTCSTLPRIGDFDDQIAIEIYSRAR